MVTLCLVVEKIKENSRNWNQNPQWAPILQQPPLRVVKANPRPNIQSLIQANKLKPPKTNTRTLKEISNPYLCKNPNTQQGGNNSLLRLPRASSHWWAWTTFWKTFTHCLNRLAKCRKGICRSQAKEASRCPRILGKYEKCKVNKIFQRKTLEEEVRKRETKTKLNG